MASFNSPATTGQQYLELHEYSSQTEKTRTALKPNAYNERQGVGLRGVDATSTRNDHSRLPFTRGELQEECVSYASIMVYVEADRAPERRVQLAASLANRFNAALTGVSALAILPPLVIDGRVLDEMTGIDVELMKSKLAAAGTWFRGIVHNDRLGWRSALDHPGDVLVREARYADLVVIGSKGRGGSAYRTLNTGEAVLKLGRPALVVPDG